MTPEDLDRAIMFMTRQLGTLDADKPNEERMASLRHMSLAIVCMRTIKVAMERDGNGNGGDNA